MKNGLKIYQNEIFNIIYETCHSIQNPQRKQEKNLKEGLQKKEELSIKEKMEMLYEKVLFDLRINQDKRTKTERVKVFGSLFNDIYLKIKSVRDKCTLEKLKEKKKSF
jgi:hypothetical protein